jgi:transcriptional regulator with XRE-family HTH domain
MVFLRNAIEESPKTQREIARDAGFANANALSMMKTGECKVPISRIPALAEALEIDAGLFLKTALREYHSEIWMTIEEYMRPKIGPVHEEILYTYECACLEGPIPWSKALGEALGGVFYLACQKHAEDSKTTVTI